MECRVDYALLDKDAPHRLLTSRRFDDLPVLGTVAAGFPSPADKELTDTMSLDEYLIANKEATYILKVTGDSMMEAGILRRDVSTVTLRHAGSQGSAEREAMREHIT